MTPEGLPLPVSDWSPGDYPCREEGFPPGDRCSHTSCGEAAARAELLALHGAFFAAARAEPTTREAVERVRQVIRRIDHVEALLEEGWL